MTTTHSGQVYHPEFANKVLDANLTGKGTSLAAGLRWAIERGMQVINLSLGSTKEEYSGIFRL